MKKLILGLLFLFVAFAILGCGGNSDKAFKNASKEEGEDVGDSAQIQSALFDRQKWTVTIGKNKEFPEYLGKLLSQKGGPDQSMILVSDAFYNFDKNTNKLIIDVNCQINEQTRLLKIDCGQINIDNHNFQTASEWNISLFDDKDNAVNESWTGSYKKNELADYSKVKKFWNPDIISARIKDNVIGIIFNSNIKIEK